MTAKPAMTTLLALSVIGSMASASGVGYEGYWIVHGVVQKASLDFLDEDSWRVSTLTNAFLCREGEPWLYTSDENLLGIGPGDGGFCVLEEMEDGTVFVRWATATEAPFDLSQGEGLFAAERPAPPPIAWIL